MATVSAIYGLGDPESYFKMVMHLSRGEIIDQRGILRQLAELQYTRNDIDFRRGTYRVRVRLSISSRGIRRAGDSHRALRRGNREYLRFDPLTGEIREKLPRITIFPKTHYVSSRDTMLCVQLTIEEELE